MNQESAPRVTRKQVEKLAAELGVKIKREGQGMWFYWNVLMKEWYTLGMTNYLAIDHLEYIKELQKISYKKQAPTNKENDTMTSVDENTDPKTIAIIVIFRELCTKCNKIAKEHGWWDEYNSFGDIIALIHSELSEALEEYRKVGARSDIRYENGKPVGVAIELADVVIRIFDYCGQYGIDLGAAIIEKMAYNETREYRHGGKKL